MSKSTNDEVIGDSMSDLENTDYIAGRKMWFFLKERGEAVAEENKRQEELEKQKTAPQRRFFYRILTVILIIFAIGLSREIYLNICFSRFEKALSGPWDHVIKDGYYYYVTRPNFPSLSGGKLEIYKFTDNGTGDIWLYTSGLGYGEEVYDLHRFMNQKAENDVRLYISVLGPGKYAYELLLQSRSFDGGKYHLLKVSGDGELLPDEVSDENLELMRICKDEIEHIFELSNEMWGIPEREAE